MLRAYQNAKGKYFFIKYFLSYDAMKVTIPPALALQGVLRGICPGRFTRFLCSEKE